MRLANMTWPHVEEYLRTNDTVILGVGSIECHGRHNPMGVDTMIPDHLLQLIEKKCGDVLIAPTIPYGACDSLSTFPGTVNLGLDILYAVLTRVTESLYQHGIRRFIILNGHGGNMRTIDQVGLDLQRKGALLAELNWWLMVWDMNPAWKGGHGGAEETAGVMAIDPSLVDMSEINNPMVLKDVSPELTATGFHTVTYKGVTVNVPRITRTVTENGWIGPDHPMNANAEWGKEMLETCADYIVDFIAAFRRAELPKV